MLDEKVSTEVRKKINRTVSIKYFFIKFVKYFYFLSELKASIRCFSCISII